ncbi:MAG: guanine-specific ribonuclease [Marmoricola sp.]|jgi:ribonuclease T1|nr:guanine-specific ribonuclease [Marmoricola sp.]
MHRVLKQVVGIAVVVLLVGVVWWARLGGGTEASVEGTAQSSSAGTDPDSGLHWVAAADLPAQARDTVALIKSGGPFPYSEDGIVFGNREGILPKESSGYYHEYTVTTPGSPDRGARRIIAARGGAMYYTDDHYSSFQRIEGR